MLVGTKWILKAFAPPDQTKVGSDNEERKKKKSESSASTKVNFGYLLGFCIIIDYRLY